MPNIGRLRYLEALPSSTDRGAGDPSAASVDDYAGDVIDLLDALHIKLAVVDARQLGRSDQRRYASVDDAPEQPGLFNAALAAFLGSRV